MVSLGQPFVRADIQREAGQSLLDYFDPEGRFDPPCSMLRKGPHRILELGSGQAWASLHLATLLSPEDLLILTDLPDVIPLCQDSIDRWGQNSSGRCRIFAQALAWGQDSSNIRRLGPFSHILMCDLVSDMMDPSSLMADLLPASLPATVSHALGAHRAGFSPDRGGVWARSRSIL